MDIKQGFLKGYFRNLRGQVEREEEVKGPSRRVIARSRSLVREQAIYSDRSQELRAAGTEGRELSRGHSCVLWWVE